MSAVAMNEGAEQAPDYAGHSAAPAGEPKWEPPLPYELVPATEHCGPYICSGFGTTVCDFYYMTDPSAPSVRNGGTSRPVSFVDADENAAFMLRAANAYGPMLAALKAAEAELPYGAEGDLPHALAMIRAAIAQAEVRI